MFNPLLSVMFGPQAGQNDERYAGKTLKSHGFSSTPTSAGQLNFDLKGNRMNDRINAMQAGGQGLGQIIKLLTYLKGIGAFKGSAFQEATQQPNQMGVLSGMSNYPSSYQQPNNDPFAVEDQMGRDQQMQQYLNALMMLNQRGV